MTATLVEINVTAKTRQRLIFNVLLHFVAFFRKNRKNSNKCVFFSFSVNIVLTQKIVQNSSYDSVLLRPKFDDVMNEIYKYKYMKYIRP